MTLEVFGGTHTNAALAAYEGPSQDRFPHQGYARDTGKPYQTLQQTKDRPHVFDDAPVARVIRVSTEP